MINLRSVSYIGMIHFFQQCQWRKHWRRRKEKPASRANTGMCYVINQWMNNGLILIRISHQFKLNQQRQLINSSMVRSSTTLSERLQSGEYERHWNLVWHCSTSDNWFTIISLVSPSPNDSLMKSFDPRSRVTKSVNDSIQMYTVNKRNVSARISPYYMAPYYNRISPCRVYEDIHVVYDRKRSQ